MPAGPLFVEPMPNDMYPTNEGTLGPWVSQADLLRKSCKTLGELFSNVAWPLIRCAVLQSDLTSLSSVFLSAKSGYWVLAPLLRYMSP